MLDVNNWAYNTHTESRTITRLRSLAQRLYLPSLPSLVSKTVQG